MTQNFAIYPSLKGKTVFVTGGAGGIGAETVRAFAAQGAKVGILDLNAEAGLAVLAALDGERFLATLEDKAEVEAEPAE